MDDIHTCSYYCDNPPCIKRQRDEMREKLFKQFEREAAKEIREHFSDKLPPDGSIEK